MLIIHQIRNEFKFAQLAITNNKFESFIVAVEIKFPRKKQSFFEDIGFCMGDGGLNINVTLAKSKRNSSKEI